MVAIGSQPDLLTPFVNLVANLSLPLVKSQAQGNPLGFLTGKEMNLIAELAKKLNKSQVEVSDFLSRAPKMYKVYTIPKRTSGHRTIAQPSKELKKYQRQFLELQQLPIHDAAMAYREGIGIKQNAIAHRKNKYLLKLDLENFFNSISNKLFWDVWELTLPLPSRSDRKALEKLLFWCPSKITEGNLVLSVGAPSSPLVSNFFMYIFDCEISKICNEKGIVYTRYADDLTFSTNSEKILFDIPSIVEGLLFDIFGGRIRVNRRKTRFSSMAHNRHVTGITINNQGQLSLGRKRKRYIKHLVHEFELDRIDDDDLLHLKGLLAFSQHIEPSFLQSLKVKYSNKLIERIIEAL